MKILHRFVLKSYLGPFILTFFIALFVLLMQFLWKYIDDLVGKGLEWYIIAKLLFFTSASLVPLALPLAILLSSIMTLGNLAEHYELAAMKSSGLSLQKIVSPLVVTSILISIGAFLFSNYVLPIANLKSLSLLYDVRQQKPAIDIQEGIFYSGIENFTIRVAKKDPDGVTLRNLMIYDHTDRAGNNKVFVAKKGKMELSKDKRFLVVTLNDGYSYEEQVKTEKTEEGAVHPFFRSKFKEEVKRFDLSEFKLNRTQEDLFKDNHQMLNVTQLMQEIDSLEFDFIKARVRFERQYVNALEGYKKGYVEAVSADTLKPYILDNFSKEERLKIIETAGNIIRNQENFISNHKEEYNYKERTKTRFMIEWHRKFTLSFACMVLFFIGAPLGAIIKKGGLGLPLVVSVCFFIFFHVLSITGEKFAKEEVWPVYQGMWLAPAVILPIGIFLTYKATTDSALFDFDSYKNFFKKLFRSKQ